MSIVNFFLTFNTTRNYLNKNKLKKIKKIVPKIHIEFCHANIIIMQFAN